MNILRPLFKNLGLVLALTLFFVRGAYPYSLSINSSGKRMFWPGERPQVIFACNPANRSGLSDQDVVQALSKGLSRWSSASLGRVGFDVWMGREPSLYLQNSDYNGQNSFYFASQSNAGASLVSNQVIGLTQVWYSVQTGEILETDVVLNDRDFEFSTRPSDTSANGRRVYIENVLTHEIGHAYGIGHAPSMQATMLFVEAREQAHLSCDDQAAIQAQYPSFTSPEKGALFGKVLDSSQRPAFGVNVVAVSLERGGVQATALTDRDGNYRIDSLDAGHFVLFAEPVYAGGTALPSFYSGLNHRVCPSSRLFSRTPLLEVRGGVERPTLLEVVSGGEVSVTPLVLKCSGSSENSFPAWIGSTDFTRAPELINGTAYSQQNFAIAESFSGQSQSVYYKLGQIAGRLFLSSTSFSIYSPSRARLTLVDAQGKAVPVDYSGERFQGSSGFINRDWMIFAQSLPLGDYWIRADLEPVSYLEYPAGYYSVDAKPLMILTGSLNGGPEMSRLPASSRCLMEDPGGAFSYKTGAPPRNSTSRNKEEVSTGFCGNIENKNPPGPSGPAKIPNLLEVVGWFVPWILMIVYVVALRFKVVSRLRKLVKRYLAGGQ